VHLQNLNNHHRRNENAKIVRDPIKSKRQNEAIEQKEEFTYRDRSKNKSKSKRPKSRRKINHLSPREKKLIHRCTNKEIIEFERNQEDRIFQRHLEL
jgi:hypothetical protein